MKRTTFPWVCATMLFFPLLLLAQAEETGDNRDARLTQLGNPAPQRVLFVGNSYLYYNDSLHNHVKRIAEENGPLGPGDYRYKSATIGGASLSHHPLDSLLEPGRLGIDEPFELVILQGGSGETLSDPRRAQFREKAIEMVGAVRARGGEAALYMTHAYVPPHDKYDPDMIDRITQTYLPVGNELGVLVIPVGLAFELAYKRRPGLQLHKVFDGTHPSLLGTYLAACVVYQSIYGKTVVGIDYDYFGAVDEESAAFLQAIADETVQSFYQREP